MPKLYLTKLTSKLSLLNIFLRVTGGLGFEMWLTLEIDLVETHTRRTFQKHGY